MRDRRWIVIHCQDLINRGKSLAFYCFNFNIIPAGICMKYSSYEVYSFQSSTEFPIKRSDASL